VITNLTAEGLSCIRTNDGDDLLYVVSWSGNDFDGDSANDTLSFELRVDGFTGSTYSYSTNAGQSSMTALGASSDVTAINDTWGVGGDYDVDAGQSLRFSITNVQVSAPGTIGAVEGFTAMNALEPNGGNSHRLIFGEGSELVSKEFSTPDVSYTFATTHPVVVTGAGSSSSATQWAVSSVSFKLSVSNSTHSSVWDDLTDYSDYVVGPLMGDEYPAQASSSNFPSFSWDTVPRWLIVRKASAYTDAEVDSMAVHYDLIVWEKANKAGFDTNDEGILDVSTRVRAVNPSIKNIFYFNSWIHYTGYRSDETYNTWDWSDHTTDTNGTEIVYQFKDLYCTHNYAVSEMRDWWVNSLLDITTNSVIDGIMIDKVTSTPASFYDLNGLPVSDVLKMYDALKQGLPEGKLFLGNTLRNERNYAGRAHMEVQDGSYLERWDLPNGNCTPEQSDAEAVAVSLQLMREALAKGKIILFKTSGPDTSQSELEAAVDYPLALFLIVAETNAYFAYQADVNALTASWVWDVSWLPEFNRPLGAPHGNPVKDGFVYTRSYEHVDVRVDLETKEVVLAWDSVDSDADGLDDLWEYRNFGGTTNAVVTANPDGDAYSNEQEYIAGLNPNGFDTFVVSNFTAGTTHAFEWTAVSGCVYSVYGASNLMNGFSLIQSNVPGGIFSVTNCAGGSVGFYKITVGRE
jgi:hypothetical protein